MKTYDDKPINIGDTVYQMHAGRLQVLTFTITEILNNGNIRVVGGVPGYQLDFNGPPKSFHSNAKELVAKWVEANLHNYEVEMPKVIYKLLTLYRGQGGDVSDSLLARFAPVNNEEVI